MKNKSIFSSIITTGLLLILITGCKEKKIIEDPEDPNTVTDIDGNIYKTIKIGTQTWMAENLRVSKYNDGTKIPVITDNGEWGAQTEGACCDYDNQDANRDIYGRLYNWYVIEGSRDICPHGWYVSEQQDWERLIKYLGGDTIAGGKLKQAGTANWIAPNNAATNETGFTALPGGIRGKSGFFYFKNEMATFWTASTIGSGSSWVYLMQDSFASVKTNLYLNEEGNSIRCVKY